MYRKLRKKILAMIMCALVGSLMLKIMRAQPKRKPQTILYKGSECVCSALYREFTNNVNFFGANNTNNVSIYESEGWRDILASSIENLTFIMPFYKNYSYSLDVNMMDLVHKYKTKNLTVKKINAYPYKFIKTPDGNCSNIQILFLIKSAVSNFLKRQAIRETWANETDFNIPIKRVFLLGEKNGNSATASVLKSAILTEQANNHDILQMNFQDSYYSNTWKSRGGIKWAAEFCPTAKYVMLVDDDFYVATDLLLQLLYTSGSRKNLYMGWVNRKPTPFRTKNSKWFIRKSDYPYRKYPPFVSAGSIVMSMDFVQNFNIASQYTKHFIFDDVFIAIVANKLKVSPTSNVLFYSGKISYSKKLFWKTLVSHDYGNPVELKKAWQCHMAIVNSKGTC